MTWHYLDLDRELYERELTSFIPPRVFDAHAHLYDVSHLGDAAPALLSAGPQRAGLQTYRRLIDQVTPATRVTGGLFFAFPSSNVNVDAANDFVRDEVR